LKEEWQKKKKKHMNMIGKGMEQKGE
jgi:hypothetical protein